MRKDPCLDSLHIARQDPCDVGNALSLAKADLVRREIERMSTQLGHSHVKRDARAQTRLLKDHGQRLAGK